VPLPTPILATLLLSGALAGSLPAQSRLPFWGTEAQADDGHWPAAEHGGRAVRDLRATALMSLAILADGTTMRSGAHRQIVKNGIKWIRDQQDPMGRFWLQSEPDWILDHAIATCAVAEATRLSNYRLTGATTERAFPPLIQHLQLLPVGRADAELLLWCAWGALSFEEWRLGTSEEPEPKLPTSRAAELVAEVRRHFPHAIASLRTDRQRAAAILLDQVLAEHDVATDVATDVIAAITASLRSDSWPEADAEPLAVFYDSCAMFRQKDAPDAWLARSRTLTSRVEAQTTDGDRPGSWALRGAFGADGGHCCTTPAEFLVLTLYYKYCRLLVARA